MLFYHSIAQKHLQLSSCSLQLSRRTPVPLGKAQPVAIEDKSFPFFDITFFFNVESLVLLLSCIRFYCSGKYNNSSFLSFLKLYFQEVSKQLKRILQRKAVREFYVSICKVDLKNVNTCPFVQLQLQTKQVPEGRSRCHCRASQKKMGRLK